MEQQIEPSARLTGVAGEMVRGGFFLQPARSGVEPALVDRFARWWIISNDAVPDHLLAADFAVVSRASTRERLHKIFAEYGTDWRTATDLFYLRERVHRWGGLTATGGCLARTIVVPSLDVRLLRSAFAVPHERRHGSRFAAGVMADLDRDLAGLPMASGVRPVASPGRSRSNVGWARTRSRLRRRGRAKLWQRVRPADHPPHWCRGAGPAGPGAPARASRPARPGPQLRAARSRRGDRFCTAAARTGDRGLPREPHAREQPGRQRLREQAARQLAAIPEVDRRGPVTPVVRRVFRSSRTSATRRCSAARLADAEQALAYPTGRIVLAACSRCGYVRNVAFDEALISYDDRFDYDLHHSAVSGRTDWRELAGRARRVAADLAGRTRRRHPLWTGRAAARGVCAGRCDRHRLRPELSRRPSEFTGVRFHRRRPRRRTVCPAPIWSSCRHWLEHVADPVELLIQLRKGTAAPVAAPTVRLPHIEVPDAEHDLAGAGWEVIYPHVSYFDPAALHDRWCAGAGTSSTRPYLGGTLLWATASASYGVATAAPAPSHPDGSFSDDSYSAGSYSAASTSAALTQTRLVAEFGSRAAARAPTGEDASRNSRGRRPTGAVGRRAAGGPVPQRGRPGATARHRRRHQSAQVGSVPAGLGHRVDPPAPGHDPADGGHHHQPGLPRGDRGDPAGLGVAASIEEAA